MCEARRPLQQKSSVFSSSPLRLIEIFLANFLTPLPPLAQHSFPLLRPLSQSPFLPSLLRLVIRLKSCQPQLSPLVKREPQKSAAKTSSSLPSCSAPASLRSAPLSPQLTPPATAVARRTSSRRRRGPGSGTATRPPSSRPRRPSCLTPSAERSTRGRWRARTAGSRPGP